MRRRARRALLRRLWQRAMAELDTDDADAAARGEAAARQQRQAVELVRPARSVALRARLAAAEERAASADEMRLRAVRVGRSAEARAGRRRPRARAASRPSFMRCAACEAAAALAAREARNGEARRRRAA